MDAIVNYILRGVEQLLGRASGPLHFRLFLTPTVVIILAIRAGLRDAREGQPAYFWAFLTRRGERRRLLRSGLRDIGRIVIVALVVDTAYQLTILWALYPLQALIVAIACAIVPYILIRGPVTRIARALHYGRAAPAGGPAAKPLPGA